METARCISLDRQIPTVAHFQMCNESKISLKQFRHLCHLEFKSKFHWKQVVFFLVVSYLYLFKISLLALFWNHLSEDLSRNNKKNYIQYLQINISITASPKIWTEIRYKKRTWKLYSTMLLMYSNKHSAACSQHENVTRQ